MTKNERSADRKFAVALLRAFGGAIFFALPLLMTMEMWWLGMYMSPLRLVLFILFIIPVLIVLDRFSGFQQTSSWFEDAVDGIVALGVGVMVSLLILWLFDVVRPGQSASEMIGKVGLMSVPGSFGAVLANSQFTGEKQETAEQEIGKAGVPFYVAELFFMLAGAVFLAFNLAPTEEMLLIGFMMPTWKVILLLLATIAMMHGFVYGAEFHGTPQVAEGHTGLGLFARFTVVGYLIAFGVSAYVLWTFGRFDGQSLEMSVVQSVVLAFPAGIGAAAARLIL